MAIRVAIKHKTTYQYDRPISLSPHIFRLRPAVHSRTPIEAYSFKIEPNQHFLNWQQDPFGNYQARVVFPEKCSLLNIEVEVIARMEVINPFDFFVEEYAESYPFQYTEQLKKELIPYLEKGSDGKLFNSWLSKIDRSEKRIVDFLVYVNQLVHQEISYTIRMEPGVQTPEDTLLRALGSCRDSAWLLVQTLRNLGLAARFVSGYLVQLTADIKSLDGPSGPDSDFTDLHAWAEVYIPGAGWVGLDPTSGLFAGEGHIPLAGTPHYSSAAPVVGATEKAEIVFTFDNSVTRIHEDPRVTKPFTSSEWSAIKNLGYQVDEDLEKYDVRLTMGGEPTFVSIDDMESAQWNTTADGKEKRILSQELIFRLREKFGPDGMIHYGQGKWYPGEPLPRWQYGLYWRKDQYPIWQNKALIASEKTEPKFSAKDAKIFIEELTKHLAISGENVCTAYEDAFYFLWAEGKVPINIDPLKSNLKDNIERRTLASILNHGLDEPAGYVIPLQWNYDNNQWSSCKWHFRREYLYLIPGNSPIGLRLPLESLPAVAKKSLIKKADRSPFEELKPLDFFHESISWRYGQISQELDTLPPRKKNDSSIQKDSKKINRTDTEIADEKDIKQVTFEAQTIVTAICVEPRNGILYIFIPPVDYLEHYLDIIASIEATAAALKMPVRIEGYEPPKDYRIERIIVSPDPGVIEVNIHPANNWKELLDINDILFEEAFLARLGTQKYMLDGRHTGTGGGNHITIGAAKPSDSPLLRRPDLLRSLITFWQHHPSLSYLFSGSFIGPTSQAPRIDEGRDEKLYEMEIAFTQVPNPEEAHIPFWLVDRIFRHLLTDITGNTHRSEFCIDKLFSPDSSSGRLGILEFRAFEMPPHKEMSLLQILLIRTLIAAFWKKPYNSKLVRWGSQLHDKFLLPHYVEEDMKEVVQFLNDAGYPFQYHWFNSFFEFRFPRYGNLKLNGIEMEVKMGIEPWHVLGEEMSSQGTARFVDSSLEKIQVKLKNFNAERYVLLCNGLPVPLKETAVKGEFVCGIRYRAWQPPSALHPLLGTDTPLVLDIADGWNSRSVGGCTYHVSHPGGRSYETFPINAYEAEGRRISRFWDMGHHQGIWQPKPIYGVFEHYITKDRDPYPVDIPMPEVNPDYPCTIDLRKYKIRKN